MMRANGVSKEERTGVVFTCSGASDVGEVSDRIARAFAKKTGMKLLSIAGLAAGHEGIANQTREAEQVICMDGSGQACAHRLLLSKGIRADHVMRLDEFGMDKGRSPVTAVRIELGVRMALEAVGLNGR